MGKHVTGCLRISYSSSNFSSHQSIPNHLLYVEARLFSEAFSRFESIINIHWQIPGLSQLHVSPISHLEDTKKREKRRQEIEKEILCGEDTGDVSTIDPYEIVTKSAEEETIPISLNPFKPEIHFNIPKFSSLFTENTLRLHYSRFILFREIKAVCFENHTKCINKPFCIKGEFWISRHLVYIVILRF